MKNYQELSPLALAFVGDAVHTLFVRSLVLKGEKNKLNNYHNQAKMFCNAKFQKEALELVSEFLTDEEKDVVRKARNAHSKHSAKNFDEETYKKATAFEALIGYLYLKEDYDRMQQILLMSMKNGEKNEH